MWKTNLCIQNSTEKARILDILKDKKTWHLHTSFCWLYLIFGAWLPILSLITPFPVLMECFLSANIKQLMLSLSSFYCHTLRNMEEFPWSVWHICHQNGTYKLLSLCHKSLLWNICNVLQNTLQLFPYSYAIKNKGKSTFLGNWQCAEWILP